MELLQSVINSILQSYEVLGIGITLILGFLTQFFPITKDVTDGNGETKKKVTLWGVSVIPLMVISTVLAVLAHMDGEKEKEKNKAEAKQREEDLQQLISNNGNQYKKHLEEKLSATESNIAVIERNTNDVLQRLIVMSDEITKITNLPSTADKNQHNDEALKILAEEARKNKALLEQLKRSTNNPAKYSYTAVYTEFDMSKCQNPKKKGVYWELAINGITLSEVEPKAAETTLTSNNGSDKFKIAQKTPFEIKAINSPSYQFLFSGYIREYTGRSFFKGYYQYRYSGTFSQIVHFEIPDKSNQTKVEQQVPITLIAGDSCEIALHAKITRTQL
ncbi:hypothetical protein ACSLBF_13155 [Pseudoalteromonas sp. T1lg65]|uniref:hypothetical protein n=1 Tax=Pseudoalteromonas sp. T1lg65 TaxID=2077101 RepID=UPI003F78CA5E